MTSTAAIPSPTAPRYEVPIDVHLILLRSTPAGREVLLSRRAGDVYATGLLHLPSGHLDGPHEDLVTALIREADEETGVRIDPKDVWDAVVVHHRNPQGRARIGAFFPVTRYAGTPYRRERGLCSQMDWFLLDALPTDMVAYCWAGLEAYRAGCRLALHFQEPEDTIVYRPDAPGRLRLLPGTEARSGVLALDPELRAFAEQTVGSLAEITDTSRPRATSRVWRVKGVTGGTWYLKQHQNDRFHQREVRGLRTWAPVLGAAAPRLLAADEALRAVITTAVPGRPLHGHVLDPEQERACFHQIVALARRIHQSFPARPAPNGSGPAVHKADRHLAAARQQLAAGDAEFVRALVRQAERLDPLPWVETHGDFQLRNILFSGQPTGGRGDAGSHLAVIDLERSEPGPAVRDLVRLSDAWNGRADLYEAFMAGYGRPLTGAEETRLVIDSALDAVSAVAFGTAHCDPELVERGHRTLARLRAEHETPRLTQEEPGEH
ncbi:phosphotransferase [Streptomyces sp. NPDC050485]|uniref:phosphotransferase n=1 Tax=Streptomyces sp. NPDC050485 TaxID=3365617 RepID=UPI00379ABDE7